MQPRGKRTASKLSFIQWKMAWSRKLTASRICLQRITHGEVKLLIIQCFRGPGCEHVDFAPGHIITLPGYIADHRQHQCCHASQQPPDAPLQPCGTPLLLRGCILRPAYGL